MREVFCVVWCKFFCVEIGVFIDENVNFGIKIIKNKLKMEKKRIYFIGNWGFFFI